MMYTVEGPAESSATRPEYVIYILNSLTQVSLHILLHRARHL